MRVTIAILALLLLFLAVLQYRWIGQVSEAQGDRMQGSLRMAVMRTREEFNGEIRQALMTLQSGPDVDRSDRYSRWRTTSRHPDLVRSYYLVRGRELLRFNPSSERFEPAAWPEELADLREHLNSPEPQGPYPPQFVPVMIREDIPALIAPLMRPPKGPGTPPEITGWTIVELNLPYIKRELLPELVGRNFDGSEYQIEVISRHGQVIYQSDPNPWKDASADARAGLLEMRPEPPDRPPGQGRAPWELLARHRAGSLEAVVRHTRRRNLGISFAIFAIMAASIVVLVRSTERERRLAKLQMEFVAGVSHELRTPLAVICSAADNLADGLVSDKQQAQRYGSVIRTTGRRLAEMVEQILGFAGAQAGQMKLDPRLVDVPEIVDRASAAMGQASIEKHLDPDLPQVMADPNLLAQCVRNLLSNAVKYGGGDQWIGIRAKGTRGGVSIQVEDRGPGIDSADLAHVFEPFYRGRDAVAGQIHGTGLGLSLVKRIIEAHSGTVGATSRPGQGSCFEIWLPAKETATDGAQNSAG
jgi:signal transduction histidine kinase